MQFVLAVKGMPLAISSSLDMCIALKTEIPDMSVGFFTNLFFFIHYFREELASSPILTGREYGTHTLYSTKEVRCGSGRQNGSSSSWLSSRGRGWVSHRSLQGLIVKV